MGSSVLLHCKKNARILYNIRVRLLSLCAILYDFHPHCSPSPHQCLTVTRKPNIQLVTLNTPASVAYNSLSIPRNRQACTRRQYREVCGYCPFSCPCAGCSYPIMLVSRMFAGTLIAVTVCCYFHRDYLWSTSGWGFLLHINCFWLYLNWWFVCNWSRE
jgi:hypothetical protein